jgi:hypothetical protein
MKQRKKALRIGRSCRQRLYLEGRRGRRNCQTCKLLLSSSLPVYIKQDRTEINV